MTDPFHFTWTDAGAVAIIFYIVVKLLREVRAFIEVRNGKIKETLPEHCRACHVMMGELKVFQKNLSEAGNKYVPSALAKVLEEIRKNQLTMMACQKDILGKVEKTIINIDIFEDHCEGRYKGMQRSIKEVLSEAKKHEGSVAKSSEILRLIKEHNAKSAKVIDAIMREKEL